MLGERLIDKLTEILGLTEGDTDGERLSDTEGDTLGLTLRLTEGDTLGLGEPANPINTVKYVMIILISPPVGAVQVILKSSPAAPIPSIPAPLPSI